MSAISRILHATDFDPAGAGALGHALRVAVETKARLYILHVDNHSSGDDWKRFPHVRGLLGRWGLMDAGKSPHAIERELGVHVAKVSIHDRDVRNSVARFAVEHDCDLLVLWTHHRRDTRNWLSGSIAEDMARRACIQTLFVPEGARGFVDIESGRMAVASVLVPIDDEFNPTVALRQIDETLKALAPNARLTFLHVGPDAPKLRDESGAPFELPIVLRQGDVVETIVSVAAECGADLVAMPTAGRHGLFDALRGSTTERVLREAGLPVLAAPVQIGR